MFIAAVDEENYSNHSTNTPYHCSIKFPVQYLDWTVLSMSISYFSFPGSLCPYSHLSLRTHIYTAGLISRIYGGNAGGLPRHVSDWKLSINIHVFVVQFTKVTTTRKHKNYIAWNWTLIIHFKMLKKLIEQSTELTL